VNDVGAYFRAKEKLERYRLSVPTNSLVPNRR